MYGWNHKSVTENKSRKQTQNPSFSSTLLDEIYRSMDVGDQKSGEFNLSGVSGGGGGRARGSSAVEDEGIATLRRAYLVQKWMDMKLNAKNFTHRRRASSLPDSDRRSVNDHDPFFLSDHSISGYVSESVGDQLRSRKQTSCFRPFPPKPIKTDAFPAKHRQPISPGGRLTTFLNSLFTNGRKKHKDLKNERTTHDYQSTCSSASSFTRSSCLSKNSPRSREKIKKGIRRTVRFYPVSVIIDEDCRPCGQKFIYGEEEEEDFMKVQYVTTMASDHNKFNDDDDIGSDVSSDLFELDHLCSLKECDELPVYETTHFGTINANGLIC